MFLFPPESIFITCLQRIVLLLLRQTGSHNIVYAGLSNESSCLNLPSAGTAGMNSYAQQHIFHVRGFSILLP
jgi:hypothetical protein